ncbi:peptidylprolyl isomerase [bacterium]|nr:peptidylprolyl isomerase [bacterium]
MTVDGLVSLNKTAFLNQFSRSKPVREGTDLTNQLMQSYIEENFLPQLLFVAEGYTQGFDQDSSVAVQLEVLERQQLMRYDGPLVKDVICVGQRPDSAAVIAFHQRQSFSYEISHILAKSRSLADSLYDALQSGADFAVLAKVFSADLSTRDQGGQFGQRYMPGKLSPKFDAMLGSLKTDEISIPVETTMGVHIIRLDKSTPYAPMPLEEGFGRFRYSLQQQETAMAVHEYEKTLFEKYAFSINPEAARLFLKGYHYNAAAGRSEYDPMVLTLEQMQKTAVTYEGGQARLGDFVAEYVRVGVTNDVRLKRVDEAESYFRETIAEELKYRDAKQRKLDQQPEFQENLKKAEYRLLGNLVRNEIINAKVTVSDADVKVYYDAHDDEYQADNSERARRRIRNQLRAQKYQDQVKKSLAELKENHKIRYNEKLLTELGRRLSEHGARHRKVKSVPRSNSN